MTKEQVYAHLQQIEALGNTLVSDVTSAGLSSDTYLAIGEMLGLLSKAKALVGRDIDEAEEASIAEIKVAKDRIIAHTIREVTVDWLGERGVAFDYRITIPAGTTVRLVGDKWAVDDISLLINLSRNARDPYLRYCFVPDDAVEEVQPPRRTTR